MPYNGYMVDGRLVFNYRNWNTYRLMVVVAGLCFVFMGIIPSLEDMLALGVPPFSIPQIAVAILAGLLELNWLLLLLNERIVIEGNTLIWVDRFGRTRASYRPLFAHPRPSKTIPPFGGNALLDRYQSRSLNKVLVQHQQAGASNFDAGRLWLDLSWRGILTAGRASSSATHSGLRLWQWPRRPTHFQLDYGDRLLLLGSRSN